MIPDQSLELARAATTVRSMVKGSFCVLALIGAVTAVTGSATAAHMGA
jgi:hypothetical protein